MGGQGPPAWADENRVLIGYDRFLFMQGPVFRFLSLHTVISIQGVPGSRLIRPRSCHHPDRRPVHASTGLVSDKGGFCPYLRYGRTNSVGPCPDRFRIR